MTKKNKLIRVSPYHYSQLEKALGSRVEYIVLEHGGLKVGGMTIRMSGLDGEAWDVFPVALESYCIDDPVGAVLHILCGSNTWGKRP